MEITGVTGSVLDGNQHQRLMTFPNVLVTGHQGFFTVEALREISAITLDNLHHFIARTPCPNLVAAP